jgi:hypothetical protein
MSAYDDLMAGQVGDVDIGDVDIGDPTELTEALQAKLYAERPFTREDEVDLGGFDGVAIAPLGGTHQLAIQSDNPFKPVAICIPSWQAPGLQIRNIRISAVNLIEGQPIPADMFTEVSTINRVSYPTIQTSGRILIDLINTGAVAVTPNIGVKGKRIRGA